MAAIKRRGAIAPISRVVTLATADDLDGTQDNTQAYDVTGAIRIVVCQVNNGTNGTAGIDVLEISHDDGVSWKAADKVLALDSNDSSGTELNGVLNVAGTEPTVAGATTLGVFKCGPYEGKTALRIGRKTSADIATYSMVTWGKELTSGTTWVTGAPSVYMVAVGVTVASLTALA